MTSEYREQLEFTQALQGLIAAMPAKPEKAALEQGVSALRSGHHRAAGRRGSRPSGAATGREAGGGL